MSWYTLQTSPNSESKVTIEIEKKISEGLQIREVFAPIEIIYELKNGQKKERKKRVYTNYIFIEFDYDDTIWHALKKIKGVVGFIGAKGNPAVVSEKEINAMKEKVAGEAPKPKVTFDSGSNVRIKEGSFADFEGIVKVADYSKNKVRVAITIFNRETEVELDLGSIELVK